ADARLDAGPGVSDAGRALPPHPDLARVSLAGEVGTGKKVMADAAGTLKDVTMELGGKSPLIVFADADIDNAVSAALIGNFYTQGEVCTNGTRVFVHRAIREEFIERLLERTQRIRIGDPLDPDTQLGALISAEHMQLVLDYIDAGKRDGATLLHGGERVTGNGLDAGCFVEPTIFTDCSDDMAIVREEIFGPVMAVLDFDDEAEVIERANDTPYGLAAGVFTRDLSRGHRVVAQLQAGICWINAYNDSPVEMPVGGYKQSGIGRENGPVTIDHYTQLKSVYVETGDIDAPF